MLEEPEPVADLVGDAQPVVPHLVRLPEQRHLLGDPFLRRVLLGGRDARVVEQPQLLGDADVREEHGAARRLGRVRGEDKADRRAEGAVVERAVEPLERILERLPRDASFVCVFAEPSQPMMLLGEVRELEVEAEGAEDQRLLARAQPRIDLHDRARVARCARIPADALDELEQPLTFLLDEHRAEDRPQHADVAAERGGRIRHVAAARSAVRVPSGRRRHRARSSAARRAPAPAASR